MKTLILALLIGLASIAAQAQVTPTQLRLRCVVTYSDSSTVTNVITLSGIRLAGIVDAHAENTHVRTNAGLAALNLAEYAAQEIGDRGIEWERKGALAAMKAAGFTNTAVTPSPMLLDRWDNLSAGRKAAIIDILNNGIL